MLNFEGDHQLSLSNLKKRCYGTDEKPQILNDFALPFVI